MKLPCKVQINDRSITTMNPKLRRKSKRSCLAIGKQCSRNDDLYLILQSPPNECLKYKVGYTPTINICFCSPLRTHHCFTSILVFT